MTVQEALQATALNKNDCEKLLCGLLACSSADLFAHPERVVDAGVFLQSATRIAAGEPMAYVLGYQEFFGRKFFVDQRVLIPRPATEELVRGVLEVLRSWKPLQKTVEIDEGISAAIALRGSKPELIVDIGTGSGCIGLTLAAELPTIRVLCSDIDPAALEVAQRNAKALGIQERVTVVQADGLPADIDAPYLLVSNPPYIPTDAWVQNSVRQWEPHHALFAGSTGTDVLERLVRNAAEDKHCQGIALECRTEQEDAVFASFSLPL